LGKWLEGWKYHQAHYANLYLAEACSIIKMALSFLAIPTRADLVIGHSLGEVAPWAAHLQWQSPVYRKI
jgi:hypothetical protein